VTKYPAIGIVILVIVFGIYSITTPEVFAHQSGCHRWHSCPSDHGTYECGDTGYCSQCPDNNYCKAGQPISSSSTPSSSTQSSIPNTQSKDSTTNDQTINIPSWVKNNAKWWSQGQIDDSDFIKGIQHLMQNGIIKIPQTLASSSSSNQIPSWIKNNAGWWASGTISDDEFVKAIQYLVQNGIIQVQSQQCDQSLWSHVYHPQRLQIVENCKTVSGTIDNIITEKDGDTHIRLHLDSQYANLINAANVNGQHGDLVLEPICQNPVQQQDAIDSCANFTYHVNVAPVGTHVLVTGSYVLDVDHGGWAEIHPVTSIQIIH
jgi:hypothetical protein